MSGVSPRRCIAVVVLLAWGVGSGCGAAEEQDRRRIAYNEAGHALAAILTPDAGGVREVSIVARGRQAGVTRLALESRLSYDADYLRIQLRVLLAGSGAEEVVFAEATADQGPDLRRATEAVRAIVLGRLLLSSQGRGKAHSGISIALARSSG